MKKLILFLFIFSFVIGFGQTTYYYSPTGMGGYGDDINWYPSGVPGPTDTIVFDDISTTGSTIPFSFSTYSVAKIIISSNSDLKFTTNFGKGEQTFTINSLTPVIGLIIETGSKLTLEGDMILSLTGLAKAQIYDSLIIKGSGSKLIGSSESSITFNAGSYCLNNTNVSPFGDDGIANTVLFENGSIYEQYSDSSPFGLTAPASKVVFQPNSTFILGNPFYNDFLGRTFGNLNINSPISLDLRTSTLPTPTNNIVVFNKINAYADFYFDISAEWGTDKYSQIKITGDSLNIYNNANVQLRTGYGGFVFSNPIVNLGTGDSTGTLKLYYNHYNTWPISTTLVQSGSTFNFNKNVVLSSDPYGGRYKVYGTLNFKDKGITTTGSYDGSLQMMDGSTFITANPGGIIATASCLQNSPSNGEELYYTPLTTFIYNGTTPQSAGIEGMNEPFGTIKIENPTGVTLNYNIYIKGNIILQNGDLRLGGFNLIFWDSGTFQEINGHLLGDASSTLTLTNWGNTGIPTTFNLPKHFEIGTFQNSKGNTVFATDKITIYNTLILDNSCLDISNDTCNINGSIIIHTRVMP